MLTFDQYVCDILNQIKSSYDVLSGLKDRSGDLDTIKKEWIKIDRLLCSLAKRIEGSDYSGDTYQTLLKRCRRYTERYSFEREIEIMSGLYSDDPHRLKNIRLKVLESLDENKFMEYMSETAEKLQK